MAYENVIVEHGKIAKIVLNRPEKRNALNNILLREIPQALYELDQDDEVRVIVLSGAGAGFCAGADLTFLTENLGIMQSRQEKAGVGNMLSAIGKIGKIVIAQVHGFALAGGFGLAVASDLTVVAEETVLGMPEIKRALFPMNIMSPICRAMPRKQALELLFTGDNLSPREALEAGLVNRVVPQADLEQKTLDLAEKIARYSPATIRLGKNAFYTMNDMEYFKTFSYLVDMLTITSLTEDAQEGVKAFFDKREPIWKGK
ncbi:MAG: enoyl-CoA hydratase/isomerase family protein [Deltaproteobacteria bacterium]|nr:enoyl-CoA hydratase/isomerase family protein [Deltaproteobacteria bacterium]